MERVKVFDATAVIAFLNDMDYPDGIVELSEHYKVIIPKGVVNEIKKSPGKERLQDLVKQRAVCIVEVNQSKVGQILNEHPQLHRGECESIALMQTYAREKSCVVSDDLKARKIFQMLNFKGTEKLLDIMKDEGIINEETYSTKNSLLQRSAFYSRDRRS